MKYSIVTAKWMLTPRSVSRSEIGAMKQLSIGRLKDTIHYTNQPIPYDLYITVPTYTPWVNTCLV